ncbi:MAG: hypothetical protein WBR29_10835 [Gammaproteobacteria bacterium]
MSALRAEQILAYLAGTVLTTTVTGCATVNRNYPYTLADADLPGLYINQVSDKPIGDKGPDNLVFQDWTLSVECLIGVKSSTLPLDTALNVIRLAIHKAVMADITLGGLTYNAYPGEVTIEGKDNAVGEQPVAVMKVLFDFDYRTHITDPSA